MSPLCPARPAGDIAPAARSGGKSRRPASQRSGGISASTGRRPIPFPPPSNTAQSGRPPAFLAHRRLHRQVPEVGWSRPIRTPFVYAVGAAHRGAGRKNLPRLVQANQAETPRVGPGGWRKRKCANGRPPCAPIGTVDVEWVPNKCALDRAVARPPAPGDRGRRGRRTHIVEALTGLRNRIPPEVAGPSGPSARLMARPPVATPPPPLGARPPTAPPAEAKTRVFH